MKRQRADNKTATDTEGMLAFVSHAHRDSELAAEFLKMLNTAFRLDRRVLVSSNTWARTRVGSDAHHAIRKALRTARIHIALVTPHYLQSETCNAELGYMWGAASEQRPFFPFGFKLPVPEAKRPWYLQDMGMCDLTETSHLDLLARAIRDAGTEENTDTSWEVCRNAFTTRAPGLVADIPDAIGYQSMRKFIEACETHRRIVFFNVQVSFEDWFRPELQTHLALQDAATSYYQLHRLINTDKGPAILQQPELPPLFGTPTARVMFVKERWRALKRMLIRDPFDPQVRSFVDLVLIHLLMGIPLALVTVDRLDDMMREKPESIDELDFTDEDCPYENVLGLPRLPKARNEKVDEKMLEDSLGVMRNATQKDAAGIDFAMLQDSREAPPEIWRGCIEDGKTHYYAVDLKQHAELFAKFGRRIERKVFKMWSSREEFLQEPPKGDLRLHVRLSTGQAQEVMRCHRLIASRHPPFRVFHEADLEPRLREKFINVMNFVRPQYCPLRLIDEAEMSDYIFRLVP